MKRDGKPSCKKNRQHKHTDTKRSEQIHVYLFTIHNLFVCLFVCWIALSFPMVGPAGLKLSGIDESPEDVVVGRVWCRSE